MKDFLSSHVNTLRSSEGIFGPISELCSDFLFSLTDCSSSWIVEEEKCVFPHLFSYESLIGRLR